MTLRQFLADCPPEATAIIGSRVRLCFQDLLTPPGTIRDAARHGAVALVLRCPQALARAIVGLDGIADRMLLLSHDTPPAMMAELLKTSGARAVLTDCAADIPAGIPIIVWNEAPQRTQPGEPAPKTTEWLLSTSGTTGTPKLVSHSLQSLTRTTRRDMGRGRLHRWGQLYNICRFAGLQVLLQGLLGGSTLILPNIEGPLESQLALLSAEGCTALSATPTLWRKILMQPGAEALSLTQVTLGGEIADAAILGALRHRFPHARLVHIYASTEAGAAFAVTDGLPGFPASFVEKAPGGICLRVENGLLLVHNGLVRPNYFGSTGVFASTEGFVATGDCVALKDGRYHFLGRADGCINVGGNKVMPEVVEHVLLAHPAVAFARVGAKASPITGSLITAEVVLRQGVGTPECIIKSIRNHCAERLERWQAPALIKVCADLPVSSGGKLARSRS